MWLGKKANQGINSFSKLVQYFGTLNQIWEKSFWFILFTNRIAPMATKISAAYRYNKIRPEWERKLSWILSTDRVHWP